MSDTLPVVRPFYQKSDILASIQAFHAIVNKVIAQAVNKGIHNSDQVLLLLTETDSNSGYGYDENDISYPHSTDGQLIMPFGRNELKQRQFLISFDPTSCDDKTHPDPSVPPGWDWEVYNLQEAEQLEPEQAEQSQNVIGLEKIDPTLLIHIGNWSLRPIDIKWINWDFESSIHGSDITTVALNDGTRILLAASEPTHTQDLETLEYVTDSANWIPKADWLVNQEDKLVKQNR